MRDALQCPICFEEACGCVPEFETLRCGHAFCKGCISQHVQHRLRECPCMSVTCPLCRQPLAVAEVEKISPSVLKERQTRATGGACGSQTAVRWWVAIPCFMLMPFAASLLILAVIAILAMLIGFHVVCLLVGGLHTVLTATVSGWPPRTMALAAMVHKQSERALGVRTASQL